MKKLHVLFLIVIATNAFAEDKKEKLGKKLITIRDEIVTLQKDIYGVKASRREAKIQLKKIKQLMELQKQEYSISKQRVELLEKTLLRLEQRKKRLTDDVKTSKNKVRRLLMAMAHAKQNVPTSFKSTAVSEEASIRSRVYGKLVSRSLVELEELKADLVDSEILEEKIFEEREQLASLLEELNEQEDILKLNAELRLSEIGKGTETLKAHFERYQKLKVSQNQVEHLIKNFRARDELNSSANVEKQVERFIRAGKVSQFVGKLNLPIEGEIIERFGSHFDPETRSRVFKKGVRIGVSPGMDIKSVAQGRVVHVGNLPGLGRVLIVDHGHQIFSVIGHTGKILVKEGEAVQSGDIVAMSDVEPIYFEIRKENIAVDPLKWIQQ